MDYIKKIVCFGDSNTHGYNSKTGGRFSEEERWTCLLAKMLGDKYDIAEEGLEGRTACFEDPLFEGLCGLQYIHPCLMTHKPIDLLIVMLGTNDVKERFSSTPENIGRAMERLVQKAMSDREAFRKEPNILIMAPPAIEPGYETTAVAGEMGKNCVEKSRALASVYGEVSKRLGCHFLDAGKVDGVKMYPYDYMHLSMNAHKNLALALADVIPCIIGDSNE